MRGRKGYLILLTLAMAAALSLQAAAQAPQTILYQGRLTGSDGEPIVDSAEVMFRIYTDAQDPSTILYQTTVKVYPDSNGIFQVELGPLGTGVLDGSKRYLGMTVTGDTEMKPRQLITSAPYAISATNIPDGSVTTAKLTNSAVTAAKIADGSITLADIGQNGATVGQVIMRGQTAWEVRNVFNEADAKVQQPFQFVIFKPGSGLTPIAYAFINANGTKASGTANVSSSWNAANSYYEITITGESYFWQDYVTVVTPVSGGYIAGTNSLSAKLLVYIYKL